MAIRTLDVVPGYFVTLGMKLAAGRDFTDAERQSSPTPVVVNEAFARHYFGRGMALGRSFHDPKHVMEIIGVVKNASYDGIRLDVPPMVFFSASGYQETLLSLEVRTAADPRTVETAVRQAVAKVDPALPIPEMVTVQSLIDDSLAEERLLARLSSLFGFLGLAIASIGLYGLMSYTVSKRTNEIGIRMALGADRRRIRAMIARQTISLLLAGSAIGLVVSLAASQMLASFLFGIAPTDGWSLMLSCGILLSLGLAAGYFPAHRAAEVNPVSALRHE
jgi:predicted permease